MRRGRGQSSVAAAGDPLIVHDAESLSHAQLFMTPGTAACEVPLPRGFTGKNQEWVAYAFSRGSSWLRDRIQVSHIAGRFFTIWATKEANPSV